jgi:diguanylate cyclase (GGDEF)-like protein
MTLHLPTLFVVAVVASAVAGLLTLLSWVQNRNVRALALWAAAFLICAVGIALIAARGEILDFFSITIANALIAVGYGLMWGGARDFAGRPKSIPLMLAGALIWIVACHFDWFFNTLQARVALMSGIVVVYSVLSAWEFWRCRHEGLIYRLPIVAAFLAHAAIVVIRIPLSGSVRLPTAQDELQVGWWTFTIFEATFFSFCIAYLMGGLARERVMSWYKRAALMDPLTGVGNRRAFIERGERMLRRAVIERQPAVLMIFDLDEFKSINDTFGHQTGDHALIEFCQVATAALRAGDLFGRMGGEEFAALLPNASLDEGLDVAERIRASFEAQSLTFGANTLTATVSVGMAMARDPSQGLSALIIAADRALYRAKENGRNRIECERDRRADGPEAASTAPHQALG